MDFLDLRADGGAVVHMAGGAVVALDGAEAATLRAALLQPGVGAGHVAEGDNATAIDDGQHSGLDAIPTRRRSCGEVVEG